MDVFLSTWSIPCHHPLYVMSPSTTCHVFLQETIYLCFQTVFCDWQNVFVSSKAVYWAAQLVRQRRATNSQGPPKAARSLASYIFVFHVTFVSKQGERVRCLTSVDGCTAQAWYSSTALWPDHFASWTAYVKYVGDQLTMQFIFV
jgi:hypothetical protein